MNLSPLNLENDFKMMSLRVWEGAQRHLAHWVFVSLLSSPQNSTQVSLAVGNSVSKGSAFCLGAAWTLQFFLMWG